MAKITEKRLDKENKVCYTIPISKKSAGGLGYWNTLMGTSEFPRTFR